MKSFFIWLIVVLSVGMNMSAQGGGSIAGQGGHIVSSRVVSVDTIYKTQSPGKDYSQIRIIDFPEISGLTVKQNLNLFKIVKDEHQEILMLTDQKQELQNKIEQAKKQKDIDKDTKTIAKFDNNAKKASIAADKKIRKILTNDQYNEFIEKRDLIKFSEPPILEGYKKADRILVKQITEVHTIR